MSFDEIEKMDISEAGKMLALCRRHAVDLLQRQKTPMSAKRLISILEREADGRGIPFSRGGQTRGDGYRCALTSLEAQRRAIKTSDWKLLWHEYYD